MQDEASRDLWLQICTTVRGFEPVMNMHNTGYFEALCLAVKSEFGVQVQDLVPAWNMM